MSMSKIRNYARANDALVFLIRHTRDGYTKTIAKIVDSATNRVIARITVTN